MARPLSLLRRLAQAVPVLLILPALLVPAALTVADRLAPTAWTDRFALPALVNYLPVPPTPAWSIESWRSGQFQTGATDWFASVLVPRSLAVRATNQLYYAVFHKSYMYEKRIAIGRDETLYETYAIAAACSPAKPHPAERFAGFVAKMAALHARLAQENKLLLFMVTPNKAEMMPEFLPPSACKGAVGTGPDRVLLDQLLTQAGVPVIDAQEAVQAMKRQDPLPPYPRGGTHWSRLAASRVAETTIRTIDQLAGQDFGGFEQGPVRWDQRPVKSDGDLARLLNLWHPPLDYPTGTAELACRPTPLGRDAGIIVVGDSFIEQLMDPILECGLFGRAEYYFYYDLFHSDLVTHETSHIDHTRYDWPALFGRTQVVLVELNDAYIPDSMRHLDRFLTDALAGAP